MIATSRYRWGNVAVVAFVVIVALRTATAAAAGCTYNSDTDGPLFTVATNCTDEVVIIGPTNVVIDMRSVMVPLSITGAISNVTIYVSDVTILEDNPSWLTNPNWFSLLSTVTMNDVAVVLRNVTLWNTSLSLASFSNIGGLGVRNVNVSVVDSSIRFMAPQSRQHWVGILATSTFTNVHVVIVTSHVVMTWDRKLVDDVALGLVFVNLLQSSSARGLQVHVNQSSITHRVTTGPDAASSTCSMGYFGILMVSDISTSVAMVISNVELLMWRSVLNASDTATAHMSMSVAGVFAPLGTYVLTTAAWRLRVLQSAVTIVGQDSAVVLVWTSGIHDGSTVDILDSVVQLHRRGVGSMTKLSCESSFVKGDGATITNSVINVHNVTGFSRADAGDTTDPDVVDASAGSSASLVHLGKMHSVSVTVSAVVLSIDILFGYMSRKEQVNINAFCAAAFLLDSAFIVAIDSSNFTIRDSGITASTVLSYSTVYTKLFAAGMYLNNMGLFTVSVSFMRSRCTASNVTFTAAGMMTPALTVTDLDPTVTTIAFAVTQTGLWCIGGKPSTANSSSVMSESYSNVILMEDIYFLHDAAADDAKWNACPEASRAKMSRLHEIGVVAIIGNQSKNVFMLRNVHTTATTFMLHAMVLMGAKPLPPLLAAIPVVASAVSSVATGTQLLNCTVFINDCTLPNGTLCNLLYSVPVSANADRTAALVVNNLFLRSPGVAPYDGEGAITRSYPTATKAIPRMSVAISQSQLVGFRRIVQPIAVNWSNMALHNFHSNDLFDFRCVTLDGVPARRDGTGVPSHWLLRSLSVPEECRMIVSASLSHTATPDLPVPPLVRQRRADLAMSPYLTAITAATSVVVPSVAVLMQRSMSALALAGCDASIEDPPAASDSPLQLQLGDVASGGYVRGAVVGNVVFLACACTLGMLAGLVATRHERHTQGTGSWITRAARAVGMPALALAPLSLLLQPSVSMSILSLGALGGAGDVVLGLLGLAVFLLPCAHLGWMSTARLQCEAVPALRPRRGAHTRNGVASFPLHAIAHALVEERVRWVARGRDARLFNAHYGAVFDGYVGGRTWFVWIELGTGVAFGILTGFQPTSDAGCNAQLWVNFALSAAILASAALWPYNGLLWNLNYALNAAVMMVVAVLMVLDDADSSATLAMVAAWVGVVFTLCDLILRVLVEGAASAFRRFIGLLPSSTTAPEGLFDPLHKAAEWKPPRKNKNRAASQAEVSIWGPDAAAEWSTSTDPRVLKAALSAAQLRVLEELIRMIANK